jgi:hypothetical protein
MASYPPLTDLPQHAAQVAIGRGWLAGSDLYREVYAQNPLASQLVPYALVLGLSYGTSIVTALKVVLSLALVATVVAVSRILDEIGGDSWWVFAVLPTLYGFSLSWGFLSLVVATPIGLGTILVATRFARRPTRQRLFILAALPLLLFATHVLVLGWASLVAALVLLLGARGSARFRGLLALAWMLPLAGLWMVHTADLPAHASAHPIPYRQGASVGARGTELLALLVGQPQTVASWLIGAALLGLPFAIGARPSRDPWRWAPFVATMILYLAAPVHAFGTAFLYPRASFFVLPTLLFALEAGTRPRAVFRALAVAFSVAWSVLLGLRFRQFDQESRPVAELLREAEPGKRLLSLAASAHSAAVPWRPYVHFAQWYQVEREGVVDFSFAEYFPNPFHYRPEHDPPLPGFVDWDPRRFRWSEHGGEIYDYFLVRKARADFDWDPLAGATTDLQEVARRGSWILFRQTPRP